VPIIVRDNPAAAARSWGRGMLKAAEGCLGGAAATRAEDRLEEAAGSEPRSVWASLPGAEGVAAARRLL
jgi:hypothetical protein